MRLFTLKVALGYWIGVAVCFYSFWKMFQERKKVKNKIYRLLLLILMVFIISIGGYMFYDITIDFTLYNYKTITITVREIDGNPGTKGGWFYSVIYTDEKELYHNVYKRFHFTDGKTYEIKYLPRTRTIIDSRLK